MFDALTSLFYFLRPLLSIDGGYRIAGIDLLDLAAISFLIVLIMRWLVVASSGAAQRFSKIDVGIFVYCFWCLSISIIYSDKAELDDVAKFILPMLSFVVLKSLIKNQEQYLKYLFLMLAGFLLPAVASTILIIQGQGLDKVNYWTGLPRYQGVFINSHNFGHNMAFMLMLALVYIWMLYNRRKSGRRWLGYWNAVLLIFVISIGLYNLYESFVRTTWLGLLIFVLILAYKQNKKVAISVTIVVALAVFVAAPLLELVFHDVVEVTEGKRDKELIASGRPYIWSHNLNIFSNLSIDRKLAGVGIGNRRDVFSSAYSTDNVWNSHNDFLEVMMQTGLIGLLIFLFIQYQIFRRIQRLPSHDKTAFLALFVAVTCMNFSSNSYVVRFSIGQMLYMVMAYIESRPTYQKSAVSAPVNTTQNEKYKITRLGRILQPKRELIGDKRDV